MNTISDEVLDFFEKWYIKQYPTESNGLLGAWVHTKAEELIKDDPKYWAEVGNWRIYEESKRLCPSCAFEVLENER